MYILKRFLFITILYIPLLGINSQWLEEDALHYKSLFNSYYYPDELTSNKNNHHIIIKLLKKLYPKLVQEHNKIKTREYLFDSYKELGYHYKAVCAYKGLKENFKLTDQQLQYFYNQQYDLIKNIDNIDKNKLIEIYRQIIKFNPTNLKNAELWQKVAQLYGELGDEANTVESYKNLLTLHPLSSQAKTSYASFIKIYSNRIDKVDNINYRYLLNKNFRQLYGRSAYLTYLPKSLQSWHLEDIIFEPVDLWSSYSLKNGGQKAFLNGNFKSAAKSYNKLYKGSLKRINQAFAKLNQIESLFFAGKYDETVIELGFFINSYNDFLKAKRSIDIRDGKLKAYKFSKKPWYQDERLFKKTGFLSTFSYLNAGDIYYNNRKYAEAAKAYEILADLSRNDNHNHKQAKLLAAESWLLAGNYVKAYINYESIIFLSNNQSNEYNQILNVMFDIVDEVYRIYRHSNIERAIKSSNSFKTKTALGNWLVEGIEELSEWLFFYKNLGLSDGYDPRLLGKENIYYLHKSLIKLVPFHPRTAEYFTRLASLYIDKNNSSNAAHEDLDNAVKTLNEMIKIYRDEDNFINEGKGRVNLAETYFLYLRGNGDEDSVDNAKIQLEYFITENPLHSNVIYAQKLLKIIDEWKANNLYELAKFYNDETILTFRFWPFSLSHEKLFKRLNASKRYLSEILVEYPTSKIISKARLLKEKVENNLKDTLESNEEKKL